MTETALAPYEAIAGVILQVRGQKVILDSDLARLYGVTTKHLNQAVKRNAERFPEDFSFVLTEDERVELVTKCDRFLPQRHSSVLPRAFTEHGVVMAAGVLNTPMAVEVSVYVVRAFVRQRALLAAHAELALKLEQLERKLLERFTYQETRLDGLEDQVDDHEAKLDTLIEAIRALMAPPSTPKHPIGFRVEEMEALYGVNRTE